jgi:hypothetical protein
MLKNKSNFEIINLFFYGEAENFSDHPRKLIQHHVPKTKDIRETILLSNYVQSHLPNQKFIHHPVALNTKGVRCTVIIKLLQICCPDSLWS